MRAIEKRHKDTELLTPPPPHPPAVHQSGELLLLSPEGRLRLLDAVFLRFDDLVAQTDVLKVETIASVYLVAANGAPRLKAFFIVTSLSFSYRY